MSNVEWLGDTESNYKLTDHRHYTKHISKQSVYRYLYSYPKQPVFQKKTKRILKRKCLVF